MSDSQASEKAQKTAPAAPAPDEPALPPAWLTRLARRPFVLLGLLGLLLWLPGILSLPALDRDESRFAQSSRQMVESHDLVDIRFGHVPRYKKPIGIYWLQASATAIAAPFTHRDDRIWTYRLPSLLGAIAASWLTVWCALAVAGAEVAFLSGFLMLGTVLLTAEASIATTDAVLLACVLGVQGLLLRLYRAARDAEFPAPRSRTLMWGWAALGFGILVKGPVVLGVAAASLMGLVGWDFWGRRRSQKPAVPPAPESSEASSQSPAPALSQTPSEPSPTPLPDASPPQGPVWAWLVALKSWRGIGLALLLILPWLIAITLQSRGAFLEEALGNDFAAKMAGGQESHGGWPGYYLLLSGLSFWPAILFVLPGILAVFSRRSEPGMRFLLAWTASWWLAVELVPTKLPHYVIDAYPPLAIMAAVFVLEPRPVKWLALARWIAIAQFVIGAGLFTAILILAPKYFGGGMAWPVYAAAGVGASLALAALVLAILTKSLPAVILGFAALLTFAPALTAYVAPRLEQLWITERLKPMVEHAGQPGDAPPAMAGYQEPSLVFALGKDVVLADGTGAAEVSARTGSLALVEDEARGDFLARLAELQADAKVMGELSGMNYSRGRKVHVILYRVGHLRELN